MDSSRIAFAAGLIRYPYGTVIILAGLDKVFATNLIARWPEYVSEPIVSIVGQVGVGAFLMLVGVIEVVVGALMLWRYAALMGYVAAAWLVLIAINLVLLGYLDIAARDLLLACALVAMSELCHTEKSPYR